MTGCGARSTFLLVYRNLFWQLSSDKNLHVTRYDSLSKTILRGTFEGGRRRGRQRKCWMEDIKEWTSLPEGKSAHKGLLQKWLDEDLC